MTKNDFIAKLKESLDNHVKNQDLDAWFYNDFSEKDFLKHNNEINSYINSEIPGTWKIIAIEGNGTNVGRGVFYNKKYNLELHLSCLNDDEEFIDDYTIVKL